MTEVHCSARGLTAGVYLLISLLTILVFTTGCSSSVAPPVPPLTYCQNFERFLASQGFESGTVDVPEDYDDPRSPTLRVFYYRQKGLEGTPVAVFNGGPGASSHSTFQVLREQQARRSQWGKIPFVYIDQRGTGCSSIYPGGFDEKDYATIQKYSSKNIVRDSEVIRQKLVGNKPWKVFGQSYGGQIVHRYILNFPASIASAHIHGGTAGVYGEESTYRRIQSQHRVIEEYLRRFPEDRDVLVTLSRDLNEESCFPFKVSGYSSSTFCGPTIIHRLVMMLGFSDQWTSLHQWLADFLNSRGELNVSVLQDFVNFDLGPMTALNSLENQGFVVGILTHFEYLEFAFTEKLCRKIEERLSRESGGRKPWQIDECRIALNVKSSDEQVAEDERIENFLAAQSSELIALEQLRDVIDQNNLAGKIYLYSGEFDTLVPRELFVEEVSVLGSRVNYHHFESSGHEGFLEPLVWKNLRE